jgi:hypothetical protein
MVRNGPRTNEMLDLAKWKKNENNNKPSSPFVKYKAPEGKLCTCILRIVPKPGRMTDGHEVDPTSLLVEVLPCVVGFSFMVQEDDNEEMRLAS